ncbi:hypothetical protein [Rouxiella badensis]|uniref:hypothetical protein n=1 Tax=Rouxiella badensis TaxID=1646377 RepID=UPI0022AB20AA|nr:hypothetical protein [Rouxiella badensis]WAT07369.1 hypothetical protein O1V65_13795 [Rouxiella badensis]
MVIDYNVSRQSPIKKNNLRASVFYLYWLGVVKNIRAESVNLQDAESCRMAANLLINNYFPDKVSQEKLLAEMEGSYDVNILSLENFDWLKLDERAAFWLWAYILKVDDFDLGIHSPAGSRFGENWYFRLGLSYSPSSHQERVNVIVTFFDRIIINDRPVSDLKKRVIDCLKDQWKNIFSKPLPLKWLPNDEDSILWAWNSLKSLQDERNSPKSKPSSTPSMPGLSTWFTPLNHAERCLALRAALDIWDDSQDTKKLFLLNLNKAWNQQKLRQSRTDKKALNTYLKNETKNRLDLLSAHYDIRISDMLERLINDHYKSFVPKE